jgi:hypothetical protein
LHGFVAVRQIQVPFFPLVLEVYDIAVLKKKVKNIAYPATAQFMLNSTILVKLSVGHDINRLDFDGLETLSHDLQCLCKCRFSHITKFSFHNLTKHLRKFGMSFFLNIRLVPK